MKFLREGKEQLSPGKADSQVAMLKDTGDAADGPAEFPGMLLER
ncbi:MAG: hypothetical protein Q4D60_02565 [Eubacteriales bacterium]|nr:hypothetical protein [Eubacteriales bacterium]